MLALPAVLLLVAPIGGQEATPPAGGVVPGSECTAERRPVTFLGDLVSTPPSEEEYQAPTAVPDGVPPDEQTAAEVTAAMRQVLACSNSGDVLRALSLFDDEYLRRSIDPNDDLNPETANELTESFATPVAIADDNLVVLIAIREMVVTPDGRVAVVVETDGGDEDGEGTAVDLFVFERRGDRWIVVDAVSDIDAE